MKTRAGWWFVFIAVLFASAARADEEILSFDATIEIQADGSLEVTESIRVRGEAVDIRRGIYRDFPTEYEDTHGHRYRVPFEFLDAQRDGAAEPWFAERTYDGTRIYLGSPDYFLGMGEFAYRLRYRTNRQLGFFQDHDELYWNVTGNGWKFPIRAATATVKLPQTVDASKLRVTGYTGAAGSTAENLTAEPVDGGARYATTVGLQRYEGLTVVLEFPKGVVPEPTSRQRVLWWLDDNLPVVVGVAGLIVLWAYYLLCWRAVGRDPDVGPRMPHYEAPGGLSAAALRFTRRRHEYDDDCFAAATIALAAKGAITIERDDAGTFTLHRTSSDLPSSLSNDEQTLFRTLFRQGADSVPLKAGSPGAVVMPEARRAHSAALATGRKLSRASGNLAVMIGGGVITFVTLGLIAWAGPPEAFGLFFLGVLSGIFSVLAAFIWMQLSRQNVLLAILPTVVPTAVALGALAGIWAVSGAGLAIIAGLVHLANVAFLRWMKVPTLEEARFAHELDGFLWYLAVAEKKELDAGYRPETNPQRFGEFLPFAFALDVEKAWADRFATALTPEQFIQAQPGWYRPNRSAMGTGKPSIASSGFGRGFANSISTVASPPRAPGSSSGFRSSSSSSSRSSGRSGGGGGGGGGGGW